MTQGAAGRGPSPSAPPDEPRFRPLVPRRGFGQKPIMTGHVAAIFRHPVKGFTPESLPHVDLAPGEGFPHDRAWAVENGPSGFDPEAPVFTPKQKFTVLAAIPKVAAVRSRLDDASGVLTAQAPGAPTFAGRLDRAGGPRGLRRLADRRPRRGRARPAEGGRRAAAPSASPTIRSARFRSSTWPACATCRRRWASNSIRCASAPTSMWRAGRPGWRTTGPTARLMLGWARAKVFKPIVRCAATHVDPTTAVRDLDVVKALFDTYGHMFCGIYIHMTARRAGRPGRCGHATGTRGMSLTLVQAWRPGQVAAGAGRHRRSGDRRPAAGRGRRRGHPGGHRHRSPPRADAGAGGHPRRLPLAPRAPRAGEPHPGPQGLLEDHAQRHARRADAPARHRDRGRVCAARLPRACAVVDPRPGGGLGRDPAGVAGRAAGRPRPGGRCLRGGPGGGPRQRRGAGPGGPRRPAARRLDHRPGTRRPSTWWSPTRPTSPAT